MNVVYQDSKPRGDTAVQAHLAEYLIEALRANKVQKVCFKVKPTILVITFTFQIYSNCKTLSNAFNAFL